MPKVASQAVILPAVPPHSSRQLLWPSPNFIHSSSFRFMALCSQQNYCFKARRLFSNQYPRYHSATCLFTIKHIAHQVSFHSFHRYSFSQVQSTRCPQLLCSPVGHRLRYGSYCLDLCSCKHATYFPFTVRPSCPFGHFTVRPRRWHSPGDFHSFVPHLFQHPLTARK